MPFRDVIGHRQLVGLLARAVQRESLPPSLIFAGPDGVGKRFVAVSTAQALNCRAARPFEDSGTDACGVCSTCTRIARGAYSDVSIVEPGETGSIKIEQVREVIDRSSYRPFEGARRVFIIDDADALVEPAQHALLKTLEETPPSSVFLLVTSKPDTLQPTVRSRCPRLTFRPLAADELVAALVKQQWKQDKAVAVAATADGSVGHALAASGQDFLDARDVAYRVLKHAAKNQGPGHLIGANAALLEKTGKPRTPAQDREQVAMHLRAMASLVRDVELLSARADRSALANPDVEPALGELAAYRGERGIRAYTTIDQAIAALDRNAGVKVVADWVALNL
jgi:DNA polymerase-3 subunit delta'